MNQDWTPVVLTKQVNTVKTKPKTVNPEEVKPKTLTSKSRADIAQARVAKGLTQKQLDQMGQFPTNSCNLWESGKVCPSGPQINILHRILKIKLDRN